MTDTSAKRIIRIFISSPSDVRPERAIARRVTTRLGREFAHHFDVEPVMWEREPLLASESYQEGIAEPHKTDIVVVILWSRLGVMLDAAKKPGPVSGRQVTGTEWEFEDALAGYMRTRELPELLLYRKEAEISAPLTNRAEVDERMRQKELVEDFVRRWTFDTEGITFIGASSPFKDGAEFEALLEEHLRVLLLKRLGADGVAPSGKLYPGPPYRGLQTFEPEHEQIFFGRTRARNELRELLARQAARGTAFVLVMGGSGSGKSSLVKAALVPDLAESGMIGRVGLVRTAITRPGAAADPLSALVSALLARSALPELRSAPLDYTEAELLALLTEAPEQAGQPIRQGLSLAGKAAGLTALGEPRLLLVIDQLEELFTSEGVADAVGDRFALALEGLAKSGVTWVVATLRSDFFNRMNQMPPLVRLSEGEAKYLLLPPTAGEMGQIVRQPAREAGLRFEIDRVTGECLDDTIVAAAASDPASLPLLEYLLDQLWRRREGDVLGFENYRALGGLEGAIGLRAEEVLANQPAEVKTEFPRLLRSLVTIGQGAAASATARYANIASFFPGTPVRRLVDALLAPDARLLVVDGGTVRVAHEALLRHWRRARKQIAKDRTDLQLRARLEEQQARWREAGDLDRDSLLLGSGLPLAEARDLVDRRGDELGEEVTEYVSRSIEADDIRRVAEMSAEAERLRLVAEEQKAQAELIADRERAAKRLWRITLLGVVIMGGLALLAWDRYVEAREQRAEANKQQSRIMAQSSRSALANGDFGTALALAVEALPRNIAKMDRPYVVEAERTLQDAVRHEHRESAVLRHTGRVTRAVFSADSREVLTSSWDETARLWDVTTGKERAVLRGHTGPIWNAVLSADGRQVLTASEDRTVRLWDANGRQLGVLRGHDGAVWSAAFSADGKQVLTASWDTTARLWDLTTGKERVVLRGHAGPVWSAVFSPDGSRVVTASGDGTVRLWEVASGKELAVLGAHEGPVWGAEFSADGTRVLTASQDGTARLWEVASGKVVALRGHEGWVWSARFSSSGNRVVTASDDNTARLWDSVNGQELIVIRGHEDAVKGAMFSADETRLLTISDDKSARLWDAATGRERVALRGHESAILGVQFSANGTQVLTASDDETARVWDVATSNGQVVLHGHDGPLFSARYSLDSRRILTTSEDKTARLWDTVSGQELAILRGHEGPVMSAAFSSDGARVVTASADETARVWVLASGGKSSILRGHEGPIYSAVFSADGTRVLTASEDRTARLWEAERSTVLAILHGHQGPVSSAVFSPDGKRVLTASDDRTARLWEATSGRQLAIFYGHERPVTSAVYSPDGTLVLTASEDKTARLWGTADGKDRGILRGHEGPVYSAVFSADGSRVLTASQDGTIRLWVVATGQELAVQRGNGGAVYSAVFSSDETRVLTASEDGRARLWLNFATIQQLIDYGCSIMPRPLTRKQRREFLLESDPREWPCGWSADMKAKPNNQSVAASR